MGNFAKQLSQGQEYEKKSLEYLDYDDYKHDKKYRKEYDLIIIKDGKEIKIEVKSDRQASQTGNLAIEYECNRKPSGISSTEADFYIYFIVIVDYSNTKSRDLGTPIHKYMRIIIISLARFSVLFVVLCFFLDLQFLFFFVSQ